jgi:hypothetical protein
MENEDIEYWLDKGEESYNAEDFKEAVECCIKADSLEPDNADILYNWGNALANLAESSKRYKSLFIQSFKKYAEAISLNQNYANAFYNWGYTLYSLYKRENKCTALFEKELEKFEKESEEIDDYDTFLIKGILYLLLKRKGEAKKWLLKSEKGILEILTFFSNTDIDKIPDIKVFYPLLDIDTEANNFFKETVKDITKRKRDKYKKIYILSILIISRLYVNDENEKLIAYYTNKTVLQKILLENSKFQLNDIDYSNDPNEGKTLLRYLFEEKYTAVRKILNNGYGAFASCFTFNYDSLNQFRLYGKEEGKEGTGVSFIFDDTFFSKEAKMAIRQSSSENSESPKKDDDKYTLFRCIYIDPIRQLVETVGHKEAYLFYRENEEKSDKEKESYKDIEEKIKNYHEEVTNITNNVKDKMKRLKKLVEDKELDTIIVGKLLINLRYLTKHIAFKEEQECRIIKIHRLNDKVDIDESRRIHIKYKPEFSKHIKKIYFGPKATEIELFQDILTNKNIDVACEKSESSLA